MDEHAHPCTPPRKSFPAKPDDYPDPEWSCPDCGDDWVWAWRNMYTFFEPVGGREFRGFMWVRKLPGIGAW